MTLRLSTILALAFALFTLPSPALAQTPPAFASDKIIGSFIAIEGDVTITRAGQDDAESVAAAMPLYRKDKIDTGPDSRAVAVLLDESELILGADSTGIIDEYIYNPDAKTGGKAHLSFPRGSFQYTSGMIGAVKRPAIELTIPYGTIALRGTRIWAGTLDQYGVLVLDGKAALQTRRGTALLSAGEGIDLSGINAAPAHRTIWESEKLARAAATVTLTNHDDIAKRIAAEKERLRLARGDEPLPPPKAEETKAEKIEAEKTEAEINEAESSANNPPAPATPRSPAGVPPGLAPDEDLPPRVNALEDAPEPPPIFLPE